MANQFKLSKAYYFYQIAELNHRFDVKHIMELNAEISEELIHRGFESADLDYKLEFDDSERAWMEIAKDVFGMANYGGGYIVIGIEDGTFKPIGLDPSFHKDTQEWINKISRWITGKLSIDYMEPILNVEGQQKKFAILHVHGSIGTLVIPKDDGNYTLPSGVKKCAFRQGIIYTRRNASTAQVTGDEFWQLFWALTHRTTAVTGSNNVPLEILSTLNKKTKPDDLEETLWSNLFPVIELPDMIYTANTKYRTATEIYDKIRNEHISKEQKILMPPFFLEDKRIYSFTNFDEINPLSLCITSKPEAIQTKQWLDDNKKHQKLVKLLNFNLKDLCKRKGFFHDQRHDRFFVKYFVGQSVPEVTWKPYAAKSTRQLVYPKLSKTDRSLLYCEHFAGRLRFIILGSGVYLVIEPIRVLTVDGQSPLDQNMNLRISTKKNFRYHNNNYLYDMKLWLHILAGNRQELHLGQGEGKITISILSINSRVNFGILNDQHTKGDFLDALKSEPIDYDITTYSENVDDNPLTETSLED
ncbi:MAG: ATP-binding protein [Nitrososphaerota archaeon]|jgi:hypothetical protein|nr:ATP-binding protein [Nitrososphaerota archaeon]